MITVRPIDTPGLGDRSHLVHDGEVALVLDPQRDIDRVLALADGEGVRITHVAARGRDVVAVDDTIEAAHAAGLITTALRSAA